jgi:hypothetical protein
MESKSETTYVSRVGPDQVTVTGKEIVIEAKYPMADWEVRDLNRVPIYFGDKKYFLVEKGKSQPPYAMRYLLHPWPEGESTSAKTFHTYDAEAVAERDAHRRGANVDEGLRMCLLPLYPFLGLLWSGTQQRLTRFGFVPHLISGASIFTTFCLCFAQGVFAIVLLNASIRSGKMMIGGIFRALLADDYLHLGPISIPVMLLDSLFLVALIVDVPMRYSHYLREDEWSGGFLEWLKPKRKG